MLCGGDRKKFIDRERDFYLTLSIKEQIFKRKRLQFHKRLNDHNLWMRGSMCDVGRSGYRFVAREDDVFPRNMSGRRLWGIDLSGADLRNRIFIGTDFSFGKFCGTKLNGSDLRNTQFKCTDITGASFNGADFSGADLLGLCVQDGGKIITVTTEYLKKGGAILSDKTVLPDGRFLDGTVMRCPWRPTPLPHRGRCPEPAK